PGIWGGLWSLPRFDDAPALEAALINWGISNTSHYPLTPLTHAFSHFRLNIKPWHVVASDTSLNLGEAGNNQAWIAIEDLPNKALPAPVHKLLQQLFCDAQQQLLTVHDDQA